MELSPDPVKEHRVDQHRQHHAACYKGLMLLTILLVAAGVVVMIGVVLFVRWVHRVDEDTDYPEAHGPGMTKQAQAMSQIAIGLGTQPPPGLG
jgi:hypothetical protein